MTSLWVLTASKHLPPECHCLLKTQGWIHSCSPFWRVIFAFPGPSTVEADTECLRLDGIVNDWVQSLPLWKLSSISSKINTLKSVRREHVSFLFQTNAKPETHFTWTKNSVKKKKCSPDGKQLARLNWHISQVHSTSDEAVFVVAWLSPFYTTENKSSKVIFF